MAKRQRTAVKNRPAKRSGVNTSAPDYSLDEMFVSEVTANRLGFRGEPPPHVKVEVDCEVGSLPSAPDLVVIAVTFRVFACYPDSSDPAVSIVAKFWLGYRFGRGQTAEELEAFAHRDAVRHVWPHWRELVQSTTSRMGLPPLRLPVLFPQQLTFARVRATETGR